GPIRKDCAGADLRMSRKDRGHLRWLHTGPQNLDLVVEPAGNRDRSVRFVLAQVTRSVDTICRILPEGIWPEPGRLITGRVYVPEREKWRANDNLSDFSGIAQSIAAAEDQHVRIRNRAPNRLHAGIERGADPLEGLQYRCFRRTIQVDDLGAAGRE